MAKLQNQIALQLREAMVCRLSRVLKVNQADLSEFIELVGELSLIELLNGVFLLDGQSETIGAYAGAVRFIIDVCGSEEAWKRTPKPEIKDLPQTTVH